MATTVFVVFKPFIDGDGYFGADYRGVFRSVENRFNRLSIFQGLQSHMSADYFGSGLTDGRLFKIFFFNAEDALV